MGQDGDSRPLGNALGIDFSKQLPPLEQWISPAMQSIVTDANGDRYNIAIVPDKNCSVNQGLSSVRGGGLAQTLYSPE